MDFSGVLVGRPDWALDVGTLLIRLFIGVCFVIHGLGKLGLVGTGDMDGFVAWLTDLGVPMPEVQARIAMLSEIVGGVLITLGLFTRPACALLVGTMVVAGRLGHKDCGYLITNEPPGAEYTINLAAICMLILLLGPGGVSLDAAFF